ncbi:MSHA biogenesis protein MshP [Agarivorans sp. MS3-6]
MTSLFSTNPRRGPLKPSFAKQRGSALVIAIFVIVVMALISAGLTVMFQDTSRNAAWDVLGSRANLAANSGLEQALSELFPLNAAADAKGLCSNVSGASTLNGDGFANCRVSVTCNSNDISQLDARFFELEATGSCGSGEVIVQRIQRVQARSAL